jgi:hypothetical protein
MWFRYIEPASTGTPTATDNCSAVTITYTDNVVGGNCPARSVINRTWRATDASGNFANRVQKITIDDTTPPVITCVSYTNFNPDDVPLIDTFTGVVVSDNCSANENITLLAISEQYEFDNNVPGFCPTFLTRVFRAIDECGNFSECTQTFDFAVNPECELCEDGTRFFQHIFTSPDETWEIDEVRRQGNCCNQSGSPPLRCVAYNFYLHEDAVGVIFAATEGAKPASGNFYVKIDCGDPAPLNQLICLQGGRFYTVTFCKSGNNPNAFSIQSIGGVVLTDELTVRADEECGGLITASGLDTSYPITWTVVSPNDQTLLRYLSCTDCTEPYFTPDALTPATIIYRVCGTLSGSYSCNGSRVTDCADVIVKVLPPINVIFDIDFDNICVDEIPQIYITLTPTNAIYNYAWYDGPDGTGNLRSTLQNWQPQEEGEYSLVITDLTNSGIVCNTATYNFEIQFDYIGPTLVVPPATLEIECNDTNAEFLIQQWLSTARAFDDQSSSIPVENDYVPFSHSCGQELTVTFWAEDNCGNDNSQTATIRIIDTSTPIWLDAPNALDRTVDCSDNAALLVAQALFPIAFDECESGLVPVKTQGIFPTGDCLDGRNIVNTWVVTDACGNISEVYTQTITLTDYQPPVFTFCPPEATNVADADLCLTQTLILDDPIAMDDCGSVTITWEKSGATEGSGTGTATGPFNVGITTITYTATDACGLTATCTQQVTIVDEQPPVIITCPSDVTVTAPAPDCRLQVITIGEIDVDENCGTYTLSWVKTGATTDSGEGDVNGTNFNVGVTIVTYTVTDAAGNTDECSFTVTVYDEVPPTIIECIATPIEVLSPVGLCEASATVPTPTADDPCGEIVSITHDSPYGIDEFNASGTYPIGIHTITWTILDASGNTNTLCVQIVTVLYQHETELECPLDISVFADAGENFASNVILPEPIFTDNCANPELTWILEPPDFWIGEYNPTDLEGIGVYPSPGTFWLGTSTIIYTLTDDFGNSSTCSFTITIHSAPEIECPVNLTADADAGDCDAYLDPGVPTLIQGAQPITWTWTLTNPDGTTLTGGSSTTNLNPIPEPVVADAPHKYDFKVGTTTIHWTATNMAGSDECTQTIIVTDNQPPSFDAPGPFELCVELLNSAVYLNSNLHVDPYIPDYYLFRTGSTLFDLDPSGFTDNCCANANDFSIRWDIITLGDSDPFVQGIGQPSAYGSNIQLRGDGVSFQNVTHIIRYWINDCNGNETPLPVESEIVITPRPQINSLME